MVIFVVCELNEYQFFCWQRGYLGMRGSRGPKGCGQGVCAWGAIFGWMAEVGLFFDLITWKVAPTMGELD